jgi:hypothetical protein
MSWIVADVSRGLGCFVVVIEMVTAAPRKKKRQLR